MVQRLRQMSLLYNMKKGFTLIEIIVYMALVAIITTAALTFTWTTLKDQAKQNTLSEVYYNYNFASSKIIYFAERANTFDVTSVYGSNPGKLVINYTSNPQVTFDTYEKSITLGDQNVTITKLRMQESGSDPIDLTSDIIDVENFQITSLSLPSSETFEINLELDHVNPSGVAQYRGNYENQFSITLK